MDREASIIFTSRPDPAATPGYAAPCGIIHTDKQGRDSLALDLLEVARAYRIYSGVTSDDLPWRV